MYTKDSYKVTGKEMAEKSKKEKFGYFGFTPSWLQWLNSPWGFLAGVSMLVFGQALSVIGLLAIIMPQIEKRFNFSSFDIGMIAASNDVAAVVFGLLVSHYGNFGNKVKWVGVGGIITGTGLIIFTLPHYIIGKYEPPPVSLPSLVCTSPSPLVSSGTTNQSMIGDDGSCEAAAGGDIAEWYHLALFIIGQFVAGTGTISLYSFTPAILQECCKAKSIPIMLGIWHAAIFAGPMVAFGVSKPLLELYVDIHQPEGMNLTPKDPRWIGNWWLGIIVSSLIVLLSAVYLLGYPMNIRREKGMQEKNDNEIELSAKEKMSGLPNTLKRLLGNWTYVCNTMAQNCVLLFGEGLAPFVAKILILRFGVKPQNVGLALTICALPPMIVGLIIGSLITRSFKMESSGRKSSFVCFSVNLIGIVGIYAFNLPACDEVNLAGWKTPYHQSTRVPISGVELVSQCNANCSCGLDIALPVCGSDNITYLSPCFAGCQVFTGTQSFGNCSCIASDNPHGGTAIIGNCDQNCKNWLWFLVLMSLISLTSFIQLTPSKFVLLRCVAAKDMAVAFGLQYFSTKIFAHIPGPIIFGHVVDLNCKIWQEVCDKTGYCWIYDMDDQMKTITIICGSLAGLSIFLYFLAWILYKEADHNEDNEKPTTTSDGTKVKEMQQYENCRETNL